MFYLKFITPKMWKLSWFSTFLLDYRGKPVCFFYVLEIFSDKPWFWIYILSSRMTGFTIFSTSGWQSWTKVLYSPVMIHPVQCYDYYEIKLTNKVSNGTILSGKNCQLHSISALSGWTIMPYELQKVTDNFWHIWTFFFFWFFSDSNSQGKGSLKECVQHDK